MCMKTLLRIAAVLAFLSFFTAGAVFLSLLAGLSSEARIFPFVLGLFFMGTAFFTGPFLFVLAEKCGPKEEQ